MLEDNRYRKIRKRHGCQYTDHALYCIVKHALKCYMPCSQSLTQVYEHCDTHPRKMSNPTCSTSEFHGKGMSIAEPKSREQQTSHTTHNRQSTAQSLTARTQNVGIAKSPLENTHLHYNITIYLCTSSISQTWVPDRMIPVQSLHGGSLGF